MLTHVTLKKRPWPELRANVADYSKCAKDGDKICTQAYRAAGDQWKIDYAACSDKPTAQECQACKNEADSVKMAALDVYNTCISNTEIDCMNSANFDYPPLERICPDCTGDVCIS